MNKRKLRPYVQKKAITLFLLLFFSLSSTLYAQTQKVEIKGNNITLKAAFTQIEEQTKLIIGYDPASFNENARIKGDVKSKILKDALTEILQGTNCGFKFQGNHIYIYPRDNESKTQTGGGKTLKKSTLIGKVIDEETKEPIIGANVVVKGTTNGVTTDINGNFTFSAPENSTLVISSIGYTPQEKKASSSSALNVEMVSSSKALDEVVITAFGTGQKKASVVGAVQTIRPSDLKVPSSSLSTSFAGRMAGVIAFQRSGQPGADGANFYIRGISTISGVTSPLIVIDGVQVSSADLNALDPEVIEGFSILKDATATALYGTRGANGVMIVTTKSGANLDKPKINFRAEYNVTRPSYLPKFADGPTYMRLYNEALTNLPAGGSYYTPEQIAGVEQGLNPYIFPNVNWYKEMFNDQANAQKFNFNIRGGGKKVDYFMSASINRETGMIRGRSKEFFSFDNNINLIRYAFQNNINARLSETSKISLRLNAQMMDKQGPNYDNINDIFGLAISANPVDFPIRYEPDGVTPYVKWGAKKVGSNNLFNPIGDMVSGYRNSFESTIMVNLDFEQKLDFFTKGLVFKALTSFKNWSSTSVFRGAPRNYTLLSSYQKNADGTYSYQTALGQTEQTVVLNSASGTTGDRTIYLQGMLEYNRTFNEVHSVGAMMLYNQEEFNKNNLFADNSFGIMINSLPKRKQGLGARLTYAYDNKYMIELNAGYNGSENFAKGHRFGFFPAVAVGYNVSEEKFFQPLTRIIQQLKLRASWGLAGNDQITDTRFLYLPQISLQSQGYTTGVNQDENYSGPKYNRYANYDLTWEIGEKLNAGIDLKMFNNLNINFDVFREHRRNIFQTRGTIPNYLGTAGTTVYGNTAEVLNKGFDFAIDYGAKINKDFTITAKGTFTYAANKILKYDEPADQDYPNLMNVGTKANSLWGYYAEGLFIDWAEIRNRPTQKLSGNVAPGDIKYKNLPNKNGVMDGQIDNNDRMVMGYPTVPEIVYGFGPSISYKGFDCGFFLQGVARTSLMIRGIQPFGTNSYNNVPQWAVDSHWSPNNQNIHAEYPRLTQSNHGNNTEDSSFWLRDASFLKLKDAEVGYTYKNMRIYLRGSNLLTFSSFKLWDPEQGSGNGLKYPTQRVFNLGFQMSFN